MSNLSHESNHTTRPARIGILGVGWWGTVGHLAPLSSDPAAEVVAIWSRTQAKVDARAEQYGVPYASTDYRQLIDENDLDGVIIASTPNMHHVQARYALERGLHVLVEKPFVLNSTHAMELQRLAQAQGVMLSVCHPVLFTPALIKAREVVDSGVLGQLVMISAVFAQRVIDLYRGQVDQVWTRRPEMPAPNNASYSDPQVAGGGEGHTQATHILGTLLWLTGLRPSHVYCAMNKLDTQVDVIDAMVVRFAEGCLATVGANGLLPAGVAQQGLALHGAQGILQIDSRQGELTHFADADLGAQAVEVEQRVSYDPRAAVGANFVRAILGQAPLHVPTQVAIGEVAILDAAYRSAQSGREEAVVM